MGPASPAAAASVGAGPAGRRARRTARLSGASAPCAGSGPHPQACPSPAIRTSALLSRSASSPAFPHLVASSAASGLEPVWEELLVRTLIARTRFPPGFGRRCSVFSRFPARELGGAGFSPGPLSPPLGLPPRQHPGKAGGRRLSELQTRALHCLRGRSSRHLIQAPPGFSPALTPPPPGGADRSLCV